MPAIISLTRISIGCVIRARMPGSFSTVRDRSFTSSSCVAARFHFSLGVSMMKTSDSSGPMGSVAISGVPVRVQRCSISSGNSARKSFSICVP
jgi:hypothetical protein